jgi:hypothetical protein
MNNKDANKFKDQFEESKKINKDLDSKASDKKEAPKSEEKKEEEETKA